MKRLVEAARVAKAVQEATDELMAAINDDDSDAVRDGGMKRIAMALSLAAYAPDIEAIALLLGGVEERAKEQVGLLGPIQRWEEVLVEEELTATMARLDRLAASAHEDGLEKLVQSRMWELRREQFQALSQSKEQTP